MGYGDRKRESRHILHRPSRPEKYWMSILGHWQRTSPKRKNWCRGIMLLSARFHCFLGRYYLISMFLLFASEMIPWCINNLIVSGTHDACLEFSCSLHHCASPSVGRCLSCSTPVCHPKVRSGQYGPARTEIITMLFGPVYVLMYYSCLYLLFLTLLVLIFSVLLWSTALIWMDLMNEWK